VFGIAARNGILLINHCQHLERSEARSSGRRCAARRARAAGAILMTSLATGLAVVPLVAFGDRPGQEIEYPLAIVILGGLATSTLLNLFVSRPCTCASAGANRSLPPWGRVRVGARQDRR